MLMLIIVIATVVIFFQLNWLTKIMGPLYSVIEIVCVPVLWNPWFYECVFPSFQFNLMQHLNYHIQLINSPQLYQ